MISAGNLLDHIHPAQEIGKAVGLKENRPVGNLTALLHGPQPRPVRLLHGRLLFLGLLQIALGLGNEQTVGLELLVGILQLGLGLMDGLVNGRFFLDGAGRGVFVLVQLLRERLSGRSIASTLEETAADMDDERELLDDYERDEDGGVQADE